MKRACWLAVFLILITSLSFADTIPLNIYLEGSAFDAEHRAFFMENLSAEAAGLGYRVVNYREDAE